MTSRFRAWLPELGLTLLALFFTYRELGIFPGSWLDEGLFIMTAKNLAAGKGYGISLLEHVWYYPYFLAIGPTVIIPVALSLKLFGVSIAAARLPMTLYVLGSCVAVYRLTKSVSGLACARLATLLLITFSAFINTGKPVLGEVPAFFFLVLGLLAWEQARGEWQRGLFSGVLFGLAIITKITFGILLPALGIAMIAAIVKKKWSDVHALIVSAVTALVICIPWRMIEMLHTPENGLGEEISKFVFGSGDTPMFFVLRENWQVLIRLPFLTFCIFCVLGFIGVWSARPQIRTSTRVLVTSTVLLFVLYYLNGPGWYRHLLPAHLLLLPFVPAGAMALAGRRLAFGGLAAAIALQALWQLTHFGSGYGTALAETVRIIREEYAETDLLIEQPEVLAQLPENPHWFYLVRERVSPSMPESFMTPIGRLRCLPHLRKLNEEEIAEYADTAIKAGNAHIIPPPKDCL